MRIVHRTPHRLATLLAAAVGAGAALEARAADPASRAPSADAPAGAPAAAPSAAPAVSQEELLRRLDALQAEVKQLKAQQKATETAEQKLADKQAVDATVAAVQSESARQSRLFDAFDGTSLVAQHTESGFKFHTADGNYSVNPFLQLEFRYETTFRSHAPGSTGTPVLAPGDDTQSNFEMRRLKFGADGNLFGPDLTYFLQFNVDRTSGSPLLELAWAKYHFAGTPFAVQFGAIKDPFDHEQILSSRFFDQVERTLINDLFAKGEGLTKGVTVTYDNDGAFRAAGSFNSGLGVTNGTFQQFPTNGADYGLAGRAEYKFFGDWKDYDTHFSAHGTQQDTLVAGAAFDYTEAGRSGALSHVVDAEYLSTSGLLLYGAYLGRAGRDTVVGTGTSATYHNTYDSTLRFMGSYAIDTHWEPFVQYEFIHFDPHGLAARSQDEVQVIRVGTSYYFHGHQAKIQGDVSYLPNGSPVNDTGSGVLQDQGNNEVIFRLQFQLLL